MLHVAKREGKPPDEMVLGQFLIRDLASLIQVHFIELLITYILYWQF